MKVLRYLVILSAFIVFLSCSKKESTYEVSEVNGIRVTKNTNIPADPALKIELKEVGFIENENETDSVKFIEKSYYQNMDHRGNLYILDTKRSKIHKYNSDYQFISCFGGKGEGPGEFMSAGNICINQDTIYITDWYSKKIIKYDLEGNPLSLKLCDDFEKIPAYAQPFGDYYISSFITSKTYPSTPGIVIVITVASLYDNRLNFIKDLYKLTWEFDRTKDHDPTANGAVFANNDTELFLSEKSKDLYMISVLDNSGTKIREIRKQFARVRISDEESKKLAESGEKYNKKYKMTYRNSINSMHIDKYRRLWVETPVANSDEKHFDIYKDDIFQNRVTLKLEESYRPQFIGSKIVAVNEENSNIKIYEY
jgi:hypothetical protein